jgi:hypothetical protein
VSGRWEAHEAVVSGKRYEVLTDPGEVHDFLGPRMHYTRIGLIIGEPFKESVVIGLDWYNLLTHLIGKHDDSDQVDDDYFLVRNYPKGDIDVGDDYRRAVLKLLRIWPCFGEPRARKMLNRVANELARLWWPKAGRPALVPPKTLRYFVNAFETINRREGIDQPRTTALKDAKELFGYRSVETTRKAMQPSRRRRPKPSRRRRPKPA